MKFRSCPSVESLEAVRLLSTPGMGGIAPVAAIQVQQAAALSLSGTIRGRLPAISLTDPVPIALSGTGNVRPLGATRLSVVLTSASAANADLTLAGRRGTVTIRVDTAGATAGTTSATSRFTVVGGTGAYVGATGAGTIRISIPGGPASVLRRGVVVFTLRGDRVRV